MRLTIAAIVLVLAGMWTVTGRGAETSFRAGAATSNITPPLGGEIIGGFLPIPSKHIHDELHARCLVLDDGNMQLAFVVCDLLGVNRLVSDEARRLVAERTGIHPDRVLVSATHTHSATSAMGQDRLKREQDLNEYQKFVASRIADAVQRAVNTLRPAEIGFTTVDVPEHVFNRRWFMRPGTVPPNPFGGTDLVKMNPPAGSPNLTEPAGPIDPTVSIISVREPGGEPICVFATYSLHYVGGVGDGDISADYYGMFCDRLAELVQPKRHDPPFVAMLANGTSGDINNINFRTPRPGRKPYEQMRYVADDVAQKVAAALGEVKYQSTAKLDARYREPQIGWRKPTAEQVEVAKKLMDEPKENGKSANLPRIYAERTLRMLDYPDTMPIPIQALRIGDICIGTMPCEVFAEIGLDFKRRSALPQAFMIELNHGYYGYLPTPRQHDLGGYETWMGTNRLERTASDKLLDNLVEMTTEMRDSPAETR